MPRGRPNDPSKAKKPGKASKAWNSKLAKPRSKSQIILEESARCEAVQMQLKAEFYARQEAKSKLRPKPTSKKDKVSA